jgi:dUTPase|nr:MAG TPA: deoxyuridine 5'-triphosphate nucleotidohydrolase [Caudoviricetes sp.]
MEPSFKFVRVRDVHVPTRANQGDAGMDFYVPNDLTVDDLIKCNTNTYIGICIIYANNIKVPSSNEVYCLINKVTNDLYRILIGPHATCVIPSGIRGILEPEASMLQANDKSGVSSKKKLKVTASIIDSPYTGEIHHVVFNTSNEPVIIDLGEKLVQYIHIPIYLTKPEEINMSEFEKLKTEKELKSGRGSDGMGSGKETL